MYIPIVAAVNKFIHSFIHSFIHPFIHPSIHSFNSVKRLNSPVCSAPTYNYSLITSLELETSVVTIDE